MLKLGPDGGVTPMQSIELPFESEQYKFLEWNGELLLVGISFNPIYEDNDDLGPLIFKGENLREGLTLSKMESLGESTLFVSENHCFGFVGHEVLVCKRNSIYLSATANDGLEGVHNINILDVECGASEIISCRWPSQQSGLPREMSQISQFSGALFWFRPNFYQQGTSLKFNLHYVHARAYIAALLFLLQVTVCFHVLLLVQVALF